MSNRSHHLQARRAVTATALVGTLAITGCSNGFNFDWLSSSNDDKQANANAQGNKSGKTADGRFITDLDSPVPEEGEDIPEDVKTVLSSGKQVVAETAEGRIQIEAGPGSRRLFTWQCVRRGAVTKARTKPFAGASHKGLYFDGKPETWKEARGIDKLRYEEGYKNFPTKDDALVWMKIRRLYYTYNDDGLVIGWKREGDTLHVEVWQFTIGGKKPSSMPEAENDHIRQGDAQKEPLESFCVTPEEAAKEEKEDKKDSKAEEQTDQDDEKEERNWFQRNIADPVVNFFTGGSDGEAE